MPIYFHSCLCSYLSRVPILVEDTVYFYFALSAPTCFYIPHSSLPGPDHNKNRDENVFLALGKIWSYCIIIIIIIII